MEMRHQHSTAQAWRLVAAFLVGAFEGAAAIAADNAKEHQRLLVRQEHSETSAAHSVLESNDAEDVDQLIPGLCADAPEMELTDCAMPGRVSASTNGISSVEECAKVIGERCPDNAKFISFSPMDKNDACAWFRECDSQSLVQVEGGEWTTTASQPPSEEEELVKAYELDNCQPCLMPTTSLLGKGTTDEVLLDASSYKDDEAKYGYKEPGATDNGEMAVLLLGDLDGRKGGNGWCAKFSNEGGDTQPWLRMSFPEVKVVTEIITASHRTTSAFPTEFKMHYAVDGEAASPNWKLYEFDGLKDGKKVDTFDSELSMAPSEYGQWVSVPLDPPIEAKYLKFDSMKTEKGAKNLCLRADVQGCKCTKKTPPMKLARMPIMPVGDEAWFQDGSDARRRRL